MAEMAMKGWYDGKWEVPEWKFDGKPALIINHMQMGIVGTGAFSGAPHAQEAKTIEDNDIIGYQKKLLAAFRKKGLPVIFISVVPNPFGKLPKWGFIYEMNGEKAPVGHVDKPKVRELAEVIPELGRLPEELLLYHTGCCPFTGSNLEDALRKYGCEELVLAGFTAHSTLYNTVVQATNHWYSVVVARDATGAPERDADCAEIVLNKMMRMWGLVTTTEDIIAHL
jgi:nicotinamidase-related amidase